MRHRGTLLFPLLFVAMLGSGFVISEPAPTDLLLIVILVGGTVTSAIPLQWRPARLAIALLGLFACANLVALFNVKEDLATSLRFLAITLYLLTTWHLYVGILGRYGEAAVTVMFGGYVAAAVLSVLIGGLSYAGAIPFQDVLLYGGRVRALFKDPNAFGPFLVPACLYSLACSETRSGFRRAAWSGFFIACSVGVLISFSRGAWANYVVAITLYITSISCFEPSVRRSFRLAALVTVAGLTLFWWGGSHDSTRALVEERAAYQEYDNDRFYFQELALTLALANPAGIGPGQFEGQAHFATHNSFLRVWVECGVIGLVTFALFLFASFTRAMLLYFRTRRRLCVIAAASLAGVVANSLVIDSLHWRHLWLVAAIPWGLAVGPPLGAARGCRASHRPSEPVKTSLTLGAGSWVVSRADRSAARGGPR